MRYIWIYITHSYLMCVFLWKIYEYDFFWGWNLRDDDGDALNEELTCEHTFFGRKKFRNT